MQNARGVVKSVSLSDPSYLDASNPHSIRERVRWLGPCPVQRGRIKFSGKCSQPRNGKVKGTVSPQIMPQLP